MKFLSGVAALGVVGAVAVHAESAVSAPPFPSARTVSMDTPARPTLLGTRGGSQERRATPGTGPQNAEPAGGGSVSRLQFRTLDDPADPTFTLLLGINDSGQIVGYRGSGADAAHPASGLRIDFPYTTFVDENAPGSTQTQLVGINNRGVSVGFSTGADGSIVGLVDDNGRFERVSNPMTDRSTPVDELLGVNDHGVAVGFYQDQQGAAHAYAYHLSSQEFVPVTIPVAADAVTATGINNDGDISGFYTVGTKTLGFKLEHTGHFTNLSFGSHTDTKALGVNLDDQVVGSYVDPGGVTHGFIWSKGRCTVIDDSDGAGENVVNGVNNAGQVVGFYVDSVGEFQGFAASTTQP